MHPQPKQESIFRPVYAGWLRLEVYLDAILRATTKKRSTFWGKKVHPPDKILATPMVAEQSGMPNYLTFCYRESTAV